MTITNYHVDLADYLSELLNNIDTNNDESVRNAFWKYHYYRSSKYALTTPFDRPFVQMIYNLKPISNLQFLQYALTEHLTIKREYKND